MHFSRLFLFVLFLPLFSCGAKPAAEKHDTTLTPAQTGTGQTIEVSTFPVKDSADKIKGWGYDLSVNGKRTIHQPLIPAVSGNNPFHSEEEARKTGQLAADKMRTSGNMPTISIRELDSLGIKY